MSAYVRHPHPVFASTPATPLRRRLLAVLVAACYAGAASANPVAPSVAAGQASFNQQGKLYSITNTPNTIINWQSFSIANDEVTRFIQQSPDSKVLNRITGQDPSQILGALQSNGKVFLINPNGVIFGKDARVDVGGLVASTLNISNSDFLAGRNTFSGAASGKVSNEGTITTPGGGQIYLIAPTVENKGVMSAPNGDVVLAAGHSVQLVDSSNPEVQVVVSAPADQSLNLGQIVAQGGRVGIYGALVNQRGVVNANSAVRGEQGQIILKASGTTLAEAGSRTSATNTAEGGVGGKIELLGQRVGLMGDAAVDASGQGGGGTVLVGGDYQGKNAAVMHAQQSYVSADASIQADALGQGDGGKVVVWSDNATRMYGALSARGGARGGNGGLIEASSHNYLDMQGKADTRAPKGRAGTFLLDPVNVYIAVDESTAGGGPTSETPLSGGVFGESNGSNNSLLTTARLVAALGTSNVTVTTTADSGAGNGDINVLSPVAWDNSNSLTLHTAAGYINLNANITSPTGTLTAISDTGTIAQPPSAATVLANLNLTAGRISAEGSFSGGNATLTASGQIGVPHTSLSGALTLNSTAGDIGQNGTIVASTLSVTAPAANRSTVLSSSNSIGSASFTTGGDVNFHSDSVTVTGSNVGGALTLVGTAGAINLSGDITTGGATSLTAVSGIAQTGTLIAGGDLTFSATSTVLGGTVAAGNHQVAFQSNLGNIDVGSLATANGNTTALSESTLQAVHSAGLLLVNGGGLTVSGSLDLSSSLSGGSRSVMLQSSGDLTINSGAGLVAPSALTLQASPSGSARVSNLGSISAGGVNIFSGKMSLAGGNITAPSVSLSSVNPINFGASSDLSNTLVLSQADLDSISASSLSLSVNSANSSNGDITISQPLSVPGNLSLNAPRNLTATASVAVGGEFSLTGGSWVQNSASLPAFSAARFSTSGGSSFLRVLGGDGSAGSPYQLSDLYGLQGAATQNLSKSYVLANDIDASSTANWNQVGSVFKGFVPIGFGGSEYQGNFDGAGHTISGLHINRADADEIGLIGTMLSGTVQALTLSDAVMRGHYDVGILVGSTSGRGSQLSNVHTSGSVTGIGNVGGLVGSSLATVSGASSSGTVQGLSGGSAANIGGLVGQNMGAIILSSSSANVSTDGYGYAGGLVGSNTTYGGLAGSVSRSSASGSVSSVGDIVGGLVGDNLGGVIELSTSSGTVTGNRNVGGLVGRSQVDGSVGGTISQVSTSSNVVGTNTGALAHEHIGGLIGELNSGTISEAYSSGAVNGSLFSGGVNGSVGAIVSGSISHVYFNATLAGLATDENGAVALSNAQSQQQSSFTGFDFGDGWRIYNGHTEPLLKAFLTPYTVNVTGGTDIVKTYDGLPVSYLGSTTTLPADIHGTLGYGGAVNAGTYSAQTLWSRVYDISYTGQLGSLVINQRPLGVTATGTKIYDTNRGLNSYTSTVFSNLVDGDVVTLNGGATFADKNVGTGKTLSRGDATLGGPKGGNYTIGSFSGSGDITPADLLVTGLSVSSRQYDGSTSAILVGTAAVSPLGSDDVSLSGSATGSFADKNVGTAKPVLLSGLSLSGNDASNYHMTSNISADITRRDFVTWTGSAGNHLWSDAGNWAGGIVPDGANVSLVRLPGGTDTVLYDTAAGNTSIVSISNTTDGSNRQSLNVGGGQLTIGNTVSDVSNINFGGSVTVSGGALVMNGALMPTSFIQTGGVVAGSGAVYGGSYNISGGSGAVRTSQPISFTQSGGTFGSSLSGASFATPSFSQTAGAISTVGTVQVTHEGAPLTVGNITATNGINLYVGSGAISQSAGTGLQTNSLVVHAATGITLNNPANQVRSFSGASSSGPISLVNHNEGYDMPIGPLTTVGNISVESWGGFHTVGNISAGTGSLSLVAHSPITINDSVSAQNITMNASTAVTFSNTSSVAAQQNISLTAGTGIALDGVVSVQSGGSISATSTTGGISATGTITATGASISLSAPQGSVSAAPSVFVGATPTILDSVAQAAANAAAQAAADAAAKAAADAAAKAAADAAAKAAADAAAKAAADAAAKAAADAAAKAAADAAAQAAADAAAKAAAEAAAAAAKAAADAAAKAAADAAAKAAADAAAKAAAEAAAKAAADAAAAAAAAQAAADAAAAAAQNQQNQPVSQAINSTVNIINTAVNSTSNSTTRSGSSASTSVAGPTLLASTGGGASGGSTGSTSGPSKVDDKGSDAKKDEKKDDSKTDTSTKDTLVKKDDATKKMYCN